MKNRLPKSKVIEIIDSDLAVLLPIEESHPVEMVTPLELISPERFDVMADYSYAKSHHLNSAQNWARKVYVACKQLVLSPQKNPAVIDNDVSDLSKFDELLDRVGVDGIDPQENYLAVNKKGVVIGDTQRLGVSLVYKVPVQAVVFDFDPPTYDYRFLLEKGLSRDIGDFMALTYCRLCQNMRVVVVFPIAKGNDQAVECVLSEYGRIAYEKQVTFTEFGQYNLIHLLYFNMHWIDPNGDINYGIYHHVKHRFLKDDSIKFYFFVFDDTSKIIEAKQRLRALFDLKNFSVHINDSHKETVWIAEQILNPNSIWFMNHAQPWLCKNFLKSLEIFRQKIEQLNLDKEDFCLVGTPVLAVFGLENTNEIKYLYHGGLLGLDFDKASCVANDILFIEHEEPGDLIYNPGNYFYFRGMKFLTPSVLTEMRIGRSKGQFIHDGRLFRSIRNDFHNLKWMWRQTRFAFKKSVIKLTHIDFQQIKQQIPDSMRPLVKKIYKLLAGGREKE